MAVKTVHWIGTPPTRCELSKRPLLTEFVDGVVLGYETWAIMHVSEFVSRGGTYGEARGQRYAKQSDERWLKVEG